jgi:hypothetical protein
MSSRLEHRAGAKRFFGIPETPDDSIAGDRALLGLPAEGVLRSGQIEAAYEARLDCIARHASAHSTEARHLALECEHAADRLQIELTSLGRGPLHPKAAARAAKRVQHAELKVTQRAAQIAAVVAPQAALEPGIGLSASDLTEFDRIALAILVVSGGWNAQSAKRLAGIAAEHGVSVDQLDRVVRGLTNYLSSGGGFSSGLGEIGHEARSAWLRGTPARQGLDRAEGAVERVLGRINDAIHDEVASGTTNSQLRLVLLFSVVALMWLGALGWLFFAPVNKSASDTSGSATTSSQVPALAADTSSTSGANSGAASSGAFAVAGKGDGQFGANGEIIAPVPTLAAPAKYPRAPGFRPAPVAVAIVESASKAASWLEELEFVSKRIRAARGQVDDESMKLLSDALASAGSAWPAAGVYRDELTAAYGALAKVTRGGESLRRLMSVAPGADAENQRRGFALAEAMWQAAFGAGVLTAIAVDPTQPPESAAAAREELRLRSIEIPRGEVADAFGAGVVSVLVRDARAIADGLSIGTLTTLAEASAWARALEAGTANTALRSRAALGAIDAILRAPGAIDTPSPLVDFLAYAIQIVDLSGRSLTSESMRDSVVALVVDANIPAPRIWVFTSLLDADLGIAWYGPDLVVATNADTKAREAIANRLVQAFPKIGTTAIGGAVLVDSTLLEEWRRHAALASGMSDSDAADRLRSIAVMLQALRMTRAFELGDAKAAKQAEMNLLTIASRERAEWEASPTGERFGLPAAGASDGAFESAWNAARDPQARLNLVRELAARPSESDLGPRDARIVSREALRASNEEVRQAIASLVSSRYVNGRHVLRAMLDELAETPPRGKASEVLTAMLGVPLAGREWIADARAALIERIRVLEDGPWHAEDRAGREIAAVCASLAAMYGRDEAAHAEMRAEAALAVLADALRDEARTRFLAVPFPASIDEIERRRDVRRSVASSQSQVMAAESAALLEYVAMLVVSRQPTLQSKVSALLSNATRARTEARSATGQVQSDMRAVLLIVGEGLAPEATRRDA